MVTHRVGLNAIVKIDEEDVSRVLKHKWRVKQSSNGKKSIYCATPYRLLTHFVLGISNGEHIIHLNGDSFDCRKANLAPRTSVVFWPNRPDQYSEILLCDDHAEIKLQNSRKRALVDLADIVFVSGHLWKIQASVSTSYCVRSGDNLPLAQWLLKAPDGWMVDHKDGDGLNNKRCNLRIATKQQNSMNSRKPRRNSHAPTSRFKGVYRDKQLKRKPFKVTVTKDGQQYHVGRFATEIEAAHAYDCKARELFGEFARTNH